MGNELTIASGQPAHAERLQQLLDHADVRLNGDRPWDVQVYNPDVYRRVLGGGSVAAGEAFMDGWWDCEQLDELFTRLLAADLPSQLQTLRDRLYFLSARLINMQAGRRGHKVGEQHYDAGNDLYERMLDRHLIYSCGYWREAANLDEAQEAKCELIFRKLGLEPGMRVLDIGCGWGGAARLAAERHGVQVVGVTISEAQAAFARERCRDLPVDIRLQDYRDLDERFDRIYSIGMFEHVGYKNYRRFFDVARRWHEVPGYSERFQRMWRYYLMVSAGAFRAGQNQLWQIVFSKRGLSCRYDAPR